MAEPARWGDASRGLVFSVQRFSLHDGMGIRTLVFFKGCSLRCLWCSNPEGQTCAPQLAYDRARCIGREECGSLCLEACDEGAIVPAGEGKVAIDLGRCTACGACPDVCPPRALRTRGEWMGVDDVLRIVEEDSPFYARSGGGLTLSGGEPLLQPEFAARLLAEAERRGIDTAVETAGCVPWSNVEEVCRHARQIFYDVKSLDPTLHREGAGVDNEQILGNLRRLCAELPGRTLVVRTPVVPGFNDTPEQIRAIAEFVRDLPGSPPYELLAFHRLGDSKYRQLGWQVPLPDVLPPPPEHMTELERVAGEVRRG